MNKQYAIEIVEIVDRKMLEKTSPLFKEAVRYLERLKIDKELQSKIYKLKYGST